MPAILDGDPQRARECIGEHLEHVRTTIQRMDEDRAHGANVPCACPWI